jgi:V-type H+-transporting ATPase subunit a
MHAGVVNRVDDLQVVMKQTNEHRSRILVAMAKNVKKWRVMVRKMKSIYDTMNCLSFDITSKCLIAECWCPIALIPAIQEALIKAQKLSESSIPSVLTQMSTKEEPPTLNVTNKVSITLLLINSIFQ